MSSVCWVWLSGCGHQSPRGLWLVGRTPLAGTPILAARRATSRAPSTPRLRVSSSVLTMLGYGTPDLEELQAVVIHGLRARGPRVSSVMREAGTVRCAPRPRNPSSRAIATSS